MRRYLRLLPWLAVAAFIFYGVQAITMQVNLSALLPPELKETKAVQLLLDHATQVDEALLLVEGPDAAAVSKAAAALTVALRSKPELAAGVLDRPPLPQMETIDPEKPVAGDTTVWAEMFARAWASRPPEEIAALQKRLLPEALPAALAALQEEMTTGLGTEDGLMGYDPLKLTTVLGTMMQSDGAAQGGMAFSSEDGLARILFIRTPAHAADYRSCQNWADAVKLFCNDVLKQHPGVTCGLTGHPVFTGETGNAMEHDMSGSTMGSFALIAVIFWLLYRRLRPLLLISAGLLLTGLLTLAAGGIMLPGLNNMTVGFVGILLGLTVDYAILVYEESLNAESAAEVRRVALRGVAAASVTTAAAFGALAACSVPGIAQLGILTGTGVLIGMAVMLGPLCDWLFAWRKARAGKLRPIQFPPAVLHILPKAGAAILLLGLVMLAWKGRPDFNPSLKPLQLINSDARNVLDRCTAVFGKRENSIQIIVEGKDASETGHRLEVLETTIAKAVEKGTVKDWRLPSRMWFRPDRAAANLPALSALAAAGPQWRSAILAAGFEESACGLTDGILQQWQAWATAGKVPDQPGSEAVRWVIQRFAPPVETGSLAIGNLTAPATDPTLANAPEIPSLPGVLLHSDKRLAIALEGLIPGEVLRVLSCLAVAVLLVLVITFRAWKPVALCCFTMLTGLAALLGLMRLFGLEWNIMNGGAILLALGAGIDYSIHMVHALQRHGGDARIVLSTTGRALLGCGLTTSVGFLSLANASIPGLASLGLVSGLALASALLSALSLPILLRCGRPDAQPASQ